MTSCAYMRLILICLFSFPSLLFAQSVSGTIYGDNNIILEYISVTNITQNLETFSDNNGFFTIEANQNDTLLFSSSFYVDKKVLITNDYNKKDVVIQLEQSRNNLDEVIIKNIIFDEEKFSSNFKNQILYDVDHNMQAYEKPSNGRVDFRKIFKRVNKVLSKKKEKKPSVEPNSISYSDLKLLLLEQNFNNEKLTEVLKIQEENIDLFIDFCRGKIKRELLEEKNNFLLLDKLIGVSLEFQKSNEK